MIVYWLAINTVNYFFGNTRTNAARTPKFGLDALGTAMGIRGATLSETICLPNFVTPDM